MLNNSYLCMFSFLLEHILETQAHKPVNVPTYLYSHKGRYYYASLLSHGINEKTTS